MPLTDLRTAALAAGAALVLAAALAPLLVARSAAAATVWARVTAAVAGAALLCWGLVSSLSPRAVIPALTAAPAIVHGAPVDLVDAASSALQDCTRAVPPSVPDGAHASGPEMAAARVAFQSYDQATNAYVHCVDQAVEKIRAQYAAVASATELKALTAFGVGAHDTAIDQEQAVADQFNAQIRAYRARHSKP
jgi:hypothetical protein